MAETNEKGCAGCGGEIISPSGNYTYIRYASDQNGSDFSIDRYEGGVERCFQGIITSPEQLETETNLFKSFFNNKWFDICNQLTLNPTETNFCILFPYHKPNDENNIFKWDSGVRQNFYDDSRINGIDIISASLGDRYVINNILDNRNLPLENLKEYSLKFNYDFSGLTASSKVFVRLGDGVNGTIKEFDLSSGVGEEEIIILQAQEGVSFNSNDLLIDVETGVGESINFTISNFVFGNKSCVKTINRDLLFYDATIGTGADYGTIQDAVDAGVGKLKLISDLTITANVTLPADFNLVIDLNGFVLTFAPDIQITGGKSVLVTSYSGIRDGELVFSTTNTIGFQGITATNSEAENITVRNVSIISGVSANQTYEFTKEHFNCDLYFPNIAIQNIQNAENCTMYGGGNLCEYIIGGNKQDKSGKFKNIIIKGVFANDVSVARSCNILENIKIETQNNHNIMLEAKNALNIFCEFKARVSIGFYNWSGGYGKNIRDANFLNINNFSKAQYFITNSLILNIGSEIENGEVLITNPNLNGKSNIKISNVIFQSGLTLSNCDYSTIVDSKTTTFSILSTTDYAVVKNLQYTVSAVDNSPTTREWDVYQN